MIARVAPYVFLIGLLFLVSLLVSTLVDNRPTFEDVKARMGRTATTKNAPIKVTEVTKSHGEKHSTTEKIRTEEHVEDYDTVAISRAQFWEGVGSASPGTIFGWFGGCVALAVIMAWRIDVNIFSLSALYGTRLVRCYLGASRARPQTPDIAGAQHPINSKKTDPQQKSNPITGIDALDDLPLRGLTIDPPSAKTGPTQKPAKLADGKRSGADTRITM